MNNYYDTPLPDFDDAVNLINDFIFYQTIRKLSKSCLDFYSFIAVDFLSIVSPADITRDFLYQYLRTFEKKSNSYKNRILTSLRTILKYLIDEGFQNCDIKLYNLKSASKLPPFVSESDMKLLIKKIQKRRLTHSSIWQGRRDYALLLFMYATGMRAGEVINFEYTDFEKGWIRVENAKGNKDRYIPVAKVAMNAVDEYRRYLPLHIKNSTSKVFITNLLVPFTRLTLNNHCKNVFGMNPHLFRHTYATHLILNGCDVNTLSEFLGHSSLSTTSIYTHIQPYHLKQSVIDNFPKIDK